MKALLLEDDIQDPRAVGNDHEVQSRDVKSTSPPLQECQRKTRITFELHPSLLLENELLLLEGDDNTSFGMDDVAALFGLDGHWSALRSMSFLEE